MMLSSLRVQLVPTGPQRPAAVDSPIWIPLTIQGDEFLLSATGHGSLRAMIRRLDPLGTPHWQPCDAPGALAVALAALDELAP